MASRTIIEKRLAFREKSLERLYDAYTALVEGGVKSYMIDDRQLTRFDRDRSTDLGAEWRQTPQGVRRHPSRLVTFFVRSRK